MWIKHNYALYNTNYISKVSAHGTKLIATFKDGSEEVIGQFKTTKECNDILSSVTRQLISEDPNHPGMFIKDTKKSKNKSLHEFLDDLTEDQQNAVMEVIRMTAKSKP